MEALRNVAGHSYPSFDGYQALIDDMITEPTSSCFDLGAKRAAGN
jgi:hypothetical protein